MPAPRPINQNPNPAPAGPTPAVVTRPQPVAPDQTSAAHLNVLYAMDPYGGGFVVALAAAWLRADRQNHAKLYSVFREYYEQYAAKTNGGATS